MSLSNYPPGAEHDPNAPYNQSEPEELEVDVQVTYTISKVATISTTNYTIDEWDEWEDDGDGPIHTGGTEIDFSDTDFRYEYEHQCFTPIELIAELKSRVEKEIASNTLNHTEMNHALGLLEACNGWEIDDSDFAKA